ncbi:MAG: sigma-54 interaction domain-containing protein [Candidatus Binatia bacterium]
MSFSEEERRELARRIKWLLFLRVLVLSFFLGSVGFLYILWGESQDISGFRSLQFPLIAAYVISLGSALVLPRIKSLILFAHAQVNFDVLLITGIIPITGGLESPFPFLYNLAVMNGSILLFYRGAFMTAGFSSACYAGFLVWAQYRTIGSLLLSAEPWVMNLVLNIPTFFIIAFLGGYLSTKLYRTERLLAEKEKDYRDLDALKEALIQGVGSGVAITDLKGNINFFNTQAQALTSASQEAIKGKNLSQIFPALSYNFNEEVEGRRVAVREFSFSDSGGRDRQIRLTLAPLSDPVKGTVGFVSIFGDITKQKEMEEKLHLEEEMRRARERELRGQEEKPAGEGFLFEGVVGEGGGMDKIYQLIKRVAATNTNILITGESGTGKELVARAIHFNGPRRDRPFVAVNCSAIPENLIESQLFGHVRGAFTGAISDHAGFFKEADRGTIFLDEIGDLPLHLQVKLLRVLQEKAFTPVGASKQVSVDVRVISASNKDLRKEMEKGQFREDLFYRLNVVRMALPPLRHRKEDIPLLVQHFIRKFARDHGREVEEIASGALMCLMAYSFPGNIRELENVIEHAVAVTNKNVLTEEDLPSHIKGVPILDEIRYLEKTAPGGGDLFFGRGISLDDELATHEKCLLLGALKRSNGVQKKAAELLGINYRSFRHRLEKYGLLSMKDHGIAGLDDSK